MGTTKRKEDYNELIAIEELLNKSFWNTRNGRYFSLETATPDEIRNTLLKYEWELDTFKLVSTNTWAKVSKRLTQIDYLKQLLKEKTKWFAYIKF